MVGKERERTFASLAGPDARSVFILLLIAGRKKGGQFFLPLLLFHNSRRKDAVRVIGHDGGEGIRVPSSRGGSRFHGRRARGLTDSCAPLLCPSHARCPQGANVFPRRSGGGAMKINNGERLSGGGWMGSIPRPR